MTLVLTQCFVQRRCICAIFMLHAVRQSQLRGTSMKGGSAGQQVRNVCVNLIGKVQLKFEENRKLRQREEFLRLKLTRRQDGGFLGKAWVTQQGIKCTSTAWSLARGAPSWTVAKKHAPHGRLFDERRFGQMFSDGRNPKLLDRRGVRRETDFGAWKRCWLMVRRWCMGSFEPVGLFDVPIVLHEEEVEYLRRLRSRYPERRKRRN